MTGTELFLGTAFDSGSASRCSRKRSSQETAKMTARLNVKQDRLESALALAQRRVEELDVETKSRATNELVAGVGAVLGAVLGGRRSTRSVTTAISGASSRRGVTTRAAVRRRTTAAKVAQTTDDLQQLEQEILDEVGKIDEEWRAKPRRSRVSRSGSRRPTSASHSSRWCRRAEFLSTPGTERPLIGAFTKSG